MGKKNKAVTGDLIKVTSGQMRKQFAKVAEDLMNENDILLTRAGIPICAIVPMERYHLLDTDPQTGKEKKGKNDPTGGFDKAFELWRQDGSET